MCDRYEVQGKEKSIMRPRFLTEETLGISILFILTLGRKSRFIFFILCDEPEHNLCFRLIYSLVMTFNPLTYGIKVCLNFLHQEMFIISLNVLSIYIYRSSAFININIIYKIKEISLTNIADRI